MLSNVIRDLDATITILQAKVNVTQKGPLGSMVIVVEENEEKTHEVLDRFRQAGVSVEVLDNVR
jgi:ABC superfamily ATP binding cassette transporter, ABC protein